jgi:hypothetical protein
MRDRTHGSGGREVAATEVAEDMSASKKILTSALSAVRKLSNTMPMTLNIAKATIL